MDAPTSFKRRTQPSVVNRLKSFIASKSAPSLLPLQSRHGSRATFSKPSIPKLPLPMYKQRPISKSGDIVTPLPVVPLTVLCIIMIGEFLSASIAGPFLFFMIQGFFIQNGQQDVPGLESKVGLWAGVVASTFFLSQFLTSLLWASIGRKHGRRIVLISSLAGNTLTLLLFGTATSLPQLLLIRFAQGLFNGAVGVARGVVKDVTDSTNEQRAYALIGFCWGMGGIIGPIIGGSTENPAKKFPYLFKSSRLEIFTTHPYLLPCLIAACVTLIGCVLSLFLGWDGGVKQGAIRLDGEEKELAITILNQNNINGDTSRVTASASGSSSSKSERRPGIDIQIGHDPSRSPYKSSSGSQSSSQTKKSPRSGFAKRLLMSNDNNVFSISDLWVDAATRNDIDVRASKRNLHSGGIFEPDIDNTEWSNEDHLRPWKDNQPTRPNIGLGIQAAISTSDTPEDLLFPLPDTRPSALFQPTQRPKVLDDEERGRSTMVHAPTLGLRSNSSSSVRPIYLNTGLGKVPLNMSPEEDQGQGEDYDVIQLSSGEGNTDQANEALNTDGIQENIWKLLPVTLIVQYAIVALHGTICDQVFMSFLVTPVSSGGLGLKASDYATLIAVLCFFQMIFQFRFYPNVGPPRGHLSHLFMFRFGLFIYIPVYFLFPELRGLLREQSNGFVMFGMLLLMVIRSLASVCSYTSIMILINAMTPAPFVSLANGTAQSVVSAARFLGPLIGGAIWSYSISDGPDSRSYPFNYAFGFFLVAVVCFAGFVHSFWIR